MLRSSSRLAVGSSPRRWLIYLTTAITVLSIACGTSADGSTSPSPEVAKSTLVDIVLATPHLSIGKQRVAFLLAGEETTLSDSTVNVRMARERNGLRDASRTTVPYREWPMGSRGTYALGVEFDGHGVWFMAVDHSLGTTVHQFEVAERLPIVGLGDAAPASRNLTNRDVRDISKLTSDFTPDRALYDMTIEEALRNGMPLMVVFSTPGFCTSATCGPQVDTVSEVRSLYEGRANFIHVEIYAAPDEPVADLRNAPVVEAVHEWGIAALPGWFNESWVFVIDRFGNVSQRFEGFATAAELSEAIEPLIES